MPAPVRMPTRTRMSAFIRSQGVDERVDHVASEIGLRGSGRFRVSVTIAAVLRVQHRARVIACPSNRFWASAQPKPARDDAAQDLPRAAAQGERRRVHHGVAPARRRRPASTSVSGSRGDQLARDLGDFLLEQRAEVLDQRPPATPGSRPPAACRRPSATAAAASRDAPISRPSADRRARRTGSGPSARTSSTSKREGGEEALRPAALERQLARSPAASRRHPRRAARPPAGTRPGTPPR